MRNTYKKVTMVTMKATIYNPVTKAEQDHEETFAEGVGGFNLPDGAVELPNTRVEVERKEVTMKLTPEKFMEHAEIVSDKEAE